MSTFSGLNTAHLGLNAARQGMDVIAQNIANKATPGYTRQQVDQASLPPIQNGQGLAVGQGVHVTGINRTGDSILDARVRDATASQAYWDIRANAASQVEAFMAEPTEQGLAAEMSKFWAAWQDLSNTPDSASAGAVVITEGQTLAGQIASGYTAVSDQWAQARQSVDQTVESLNAAADEVASLNAQIRNAQAAGRNANELIDVRGLIVEDLARMSGATATVEPDGTMTVRLDGNALVQGDNVQRVVAAGPSDISSGEPVTIAWEHRPGVPLQGISGELGGTLSVLAPASDGGVLAQAAQVYNDVATELAAQTNAQHQAGVTAGGDPGGPFFALDTGAPPALGLRVVPTQGGELATAEQGSGALDASNADKLGQLGQQAGSPDEMWSSFVVQLGANTAGDKQRAAVSEIASHAAISAQQSVASVDIDEETVNLMTLQTAYQASSRVLTAIDEALSTLINRTGKVGL